MIDPVVREFRKRFCALGPLASIYVIALTFVLSIALAFGIGRHLILPMCLIALGLTFVIGAAERYLNRILGQRRSDLAQQDVNRKN